MDKLAAWGRRNVLLHPKDINQVFDYIKKGIVPPDSEIYVPGKEAWLSVSEFEREFDHFYPGFCYRTGASTYPLGSYGQARRLINSGTIPPDAEIYFPANHRWMSVSEYGEQTSDVKPLKLTPGKMIKTEERRATERKVRNAAAKTWGWMLGFVVFATAMAFAMYVFALFIKGGSRSSPILQLALVVGVFAIAGAAWNYFQDKMEG